MVDWLQGAELTMSRETHLLRTVYNVRTQQYEEIPLSEFQHLLRQGKLEETVTQSPYDARPQRIYRLI
jgi:hypothetical protein